MKKGEVWRVRIPFAPGHAQSGERPAIVVQDDPFIQSLPTVLIVPLQALWEQPGSTELWLSLPMVKTVLRCHQLHWYSKLAHWTSVTV